jgi:FAD/FMN-containing dehydrogenase
MAITVLRQDPRYNTLKKGHNIRWPASEVDAVGRIEICETPEDAADALQRIVSAGLRPTLRSGGHCYEDFVANNPDGAILDLSMLTQTNPPGKDAPYTIGAGTQLWQAYVELYKRYGVTLPGGTCGSVGAGGHIAGGGYGPLSRLHGLTVDWLSAVEILTVDATLIYSAHVEELVGATSA